MKSRGTTSAPSRSGGKSYGSEGSLNQHYKLKHPEIYLTLPNVQCNVQPYSSEEFEDHRDKENSHRFGNMTKVQNDMHPFRLIHLI